jgi:MFS family permease
MGILTVQTSRLIRLFLGLSYLGAGVGNFMGTLIGGKLSDALLIRSRRLRGGAAVLEDRLTANLWPAGFFFVPLGVLMFGWMGEYGVSLWGCIVGFGIQCFGMSQVFSAGSAYLVDATPGRGASITAGANFLRMLLACILSLVATPMLNALGPGYVGVLFAALMVLAMCLAVLLKLKGEAIRKISGF